MKQSVLRYAVSTVRWDAETRTAIEAKLRQNVKQPVHPDDLDAGEFIETDPVTMDDVMYEEDIEMGKERLRLKIIIAVLAAAVLGIGGMAAAAAFHKRSGTYGSSAVTESSHAESSGNTSAALERVWAGKAVPRSYDVSGEKLAYGTDWYSIPFDALLSGSTDWVPAFSCNLN